MHTDTKKPGGSDAHRAEINETRTKPSLPHVHGSASDISKKALRLNDSDSILERLDRARKSTRSRWPLEKSERVVELRIQRQARLALLRPEVESLPLELARLTAEGRPENG